MSICRVLVLAPLFTTVAAALGASDADRSSLDSLVAAERAFATHSVEHGMREAFLTYLCDDGIIFRPGPLNGRHVWKARANPQGTLRWSPRFAEVAGDGDLGWTTGPWEFTPAPERKLPPSYGEFVSVWKRGKDRPWCVAVDIGVSHDRAPEDLADVKLETELAHPKPARRKARGGLGFGISVFNRGVGVGLGSGANAYEEERTIVAHAINTMMSAERSHAFDARKLGVARAYPKYAAEDVRFYRDGSMPEVGMTPAIAALGRRAGEIAWQPFGSGASASADLGYSYGLATRRVKGAARADTSAYMHVWRKAQDGKWKLALDLESDFPRP